MSELPDGELPDDGGAVGPEDLTLLEQQQLEEVTANDRDSQSSARSVLVSSEQTEFVYALQNGVLAKPDPVSDV